MRRAGWWTSVVAQVWGMVAVSALLVAGLVLVNARADTSREREVVGANLQRFGSTAADTLADDLSADGPTVETLENLGSQPAIASLGASCARALEPVQRAVEIGAILVVDAGGSVRCSAASRTYSGSAFAGVVELRRAVSGRAPSSGGPFPDPVTGTLSMFTQVPLEGGRASLVYVFGTQESFSPLDPDPSITSLVVDSRSGTVLMHYPERPGAVGSSTTGTGLERVVDSAAVVTAEGPDGVQRLYRSIPVRGTAFRLLAGVSEDVAYAGARAALRDNLLLGLGALVVVGLLGLSLQRRVGRPARRLQRAIGALASDPDAPLAPTAGPRELAQVAATFNATTAARRKADGLSRALLQHASDQLVVVDPEGVISFVAPAAEQALGLHVGEDLIGAVGRVYDADREGLALRVGEWLADTQVDLELETRVYDGQGLLRSLEVRLQDLRDDPHVAGVVLTGRDVTERRAFEEHLEHQARHDALTGLANRSAVLERLAADLEDPASPVWVFFVDLDRFKLVNDSHGHATGDQVLMVLAHKLRRLARGEDLVGRFGGDEFVIVTNRVRGASEAEALATEIRATLEEPLSVGRRELFVSGSVGIALAEQGDAPETVLRNADTAMYRAKARGRNCAAFFDAAMRAEAQRQLRTESDLHRALERDQLVLHFQPVLDLSDRRIVGVEALVRWQHPHHGLVPPGDFIPVAEESGLVVPIGAWVLEQACAWAAAASAAAGRPLRVSVNVSPRQLVQPELVDVVDAVLTRTGLPAAQLCLEVTESVLVQDAHVAERALNALHERGVRLSIDDFGTGWSSLTYLQQFPIDEIKLDRSFVSKVDSDRSAAAIVGALVGMAHSLGMTVVAEGVETEAQGRFLKAHRCDRAQGFLFSRPVPGQDVLDLLVPARSAHVSPRRARDGAVA